MSCLYNRQTSWRAAAPMSARLSRLATPPYATAGRARRGWSPAPLSGDAVVDEDIVAIIALTLLPLLRAGHRVTGIDSDPGLLELARSALENLPEAADRRIAHAAAHFVQQ